MEARLSVLLLTGFSNRRVGEVDRMIFDAQGGKLMLKLQHPSSILL
jgi:hypothetical protein